MIPPNDIPGLSLGPELLTAERRIAPSFGLVRCAMDSSWEARKGRLQKILEVSTNLDADMTTMVAIRLHDFHPSYGLEASILDLGLASTLDEAPRFRKPKLLDSRVAVILPPRVRPEPNHDYMLVGAEVQYVQESLPCRVRWSEITMKTRYIQLATNCRAIAEAVELFAGGLNAWTAATEHLPMSITMRLDCRGFACQMMDVNDKMKQACGRPEVPRVCEADVADMHVLHKLRCEEAILASPPCQPFSALGKRVKVWTPRRRP